MTRSTTQTDISSYPAGLVTLVASDGGYVLLTKAAARQSTKLTNLLDQHPKRRGIEVAALAEKIEQKQYLTSAVLQQLAVILEHFATTPYSPLVQPVPNVPSWDNLGGSWLGHKLRSMPVDSMMHVQQACHILKCEHLFQLTCSYSAYRLRQVHRTLVLIHGTHSAYDADTVVARMCDDNLITP